MANCAACSRSARRSRRGATRARSSSSPKARTAPIRRPRPSPAIGSRTSRPTRPGASISTRSRRGWGRTSPAVMITNPNTCGLFEPDMIAISRRGARGGRAGLLRRRQFQRDRRPGPAGRPRHRRDAHQPAQDLLDAARRRRSGRGPGRLLRGADAVRAAAVRRARRSRRDGPTIISGWSRRRPPASIMPRASAAWSPSTARWACSRRALAYILSHGADGLRQVAEDAVLNANYILRSLEDVLDAPFGASGPVHARGAVQRQGLRRRSHHARSRQGPDRRGLSIR